MQRGLLSRRVARPHQAYNGDGEGGRQLGGCTLVWLAKKHAVNILTALVLWLEFGDGYGGGDNRQDP
jgi:hypothetical protein